jgi:hypothetical protein
MMLGWKRNDGWKRKAIGLAMAVLKGCLLFGVMGAQQGGRIERERVGQREGRGRFPELMGRFGQRFPSDPSFFPPNSRQRLSGLGFRSRQQSQNVELVGFTGGAIYDVFVKDNYAYCASVPGLLIFDVSNPSNPQLVGKLFLPDFALGVYVSGNYAYVADWVAGLRVIDVSNPSNPREISFFDTPGGASGVYVSGNYAYVADWDAGLRVIDVSNPSNPREVGFLDTPGEALDVYVSGNYAYVAGGYAGLRVIDVSNPSNPREVGFFDTPGFAYGIYVSGNYAYVADGELSITAEGYAGLRVIDVSNPSNPREVGFFDTPNGAGGVYVSGNYAYVAGGYAGLRVIDVSNPSNPREVGFFDTPDYAYGAFGVYVSGNYAYVAGGWAGLLILRFTGAQPVNRPPSVPVLLSPANNATVSPTPTFKVKSEDPDGDQVKFEIEVVKGSETKRFETGFFASGSEATFTVPENQSLSEGQWSWRARAIDNKGAASDWSDARKLIVTSAPIITFLLPISLHIGQEDHFFIVCQNITNQPWEGFAFIRIKLQNPTGIGKVAYRVWTLREENIITLATGETIDEITFPVEFIPPVGPNELKAFVVSIKSIQDTKIKRIEPSTTLILVGFAIYTAWLFYIARDLLETGATIELRRSVMLTFINAGYDIDPATADKIVKAIQQSLKERQEMNWIDKLQQLDFAYSVASKAYKLYEGQFPISSKDIAIGVLKKSVINFLKTAVELMKTGEYIDNDLKIILREHRKEIEEILRVESSQPSSKSIGPEFIKGNQPLRYIQFFKPTSNNKMRSGEITELLIINPLDPNVDVNTFAFEGVSHPAALIEQQVDIQKREARWSFRLADIGSDEVWVQFSVLPKSDLPSGTQIHNKTIMKIGDREDQTNEIVTTIDNTPPKVLMQSLDPIQQFNKFPIKWMYQDDIGEVDKVEIWISDDGKEPELWAIFPSSTTTITFQGKFGHEYKFYLVAIDKAGNQSSFPEQPLAITKAGQAPLIEKGLHLITLPIFSEISDPKQIFSFEANKWAWYDPITKKYSYYPETSASTLQPGKAFWVFFTSSHVPNAKGETVNDTQPFSVPLKQGWNLVGNPWLIPLNWDLEAIKVQQSNAIKSLKDAQAAGWIEDYAWGWEQDANNVLVYDTSIIPGVKGQLEPWKGYWVYAHTDCELILPPPSQGKGRGTRGEGRMAKGNGWSMRLQASVNGSVGEAVLGIANGTRGLAVGLPPEPPTGNNGVQVILLKNNTPLAVDLRSDGSRRQEWEVLVRWDKGQVTRGRGERKEVTLTFDGIGYAPKDVSAWLVDTVTGKRVYLRTQPSYRFAPEVGETERRFKVIVESGNERPLRIVGLKATPMRGEGLVITFALTKPAQVRGEVMTLTGRKIAVMDDGSTRMAGTHRMIWRGVGSEGVKVPVGAYLVRLVATDEDGRQVQAVTVVRGR